VEYTLTLKSVRSLDDFIMALRILKVSAGNPSITQITKRVHLAWQRAGIPASEWPARSTVGNCFRLGRRRPNPALLLAVVQVLCHGDPAVETWRGALRVVLGELHCASPVRAGKGLPPDPGAAIVGRDGLLAELAGAIQAPGARRVIVLRGPAGVGKTALAVRLGHELVDHGLLQGPVLYADLRGTGPEHHPADPGTVQEAFLRMLGTTGRFPVTPDGRTAAYQQALSRENALLLLDDAALSEQVLPLLPMTPGAAVIVTTRSAGILRGQARDVLVRPLPVAHRLAVLRRIAGAEHVNTDPAAAAQLVRRLGGLPLSLAAIGAHMRAHPNWTVADYVQPSFALALEHGGRTAIAASESRLPSESRRLLRLLSVHPDAGFDARDAAALADCSEHAVAHHLAALAAEHLVEADPAGRYSLTPLVGAYAREQLVMEEPASRIRHAAGQLGARRQRAMPGVGSPRRTRPTAVAGALASI
jgi:hypothetical protein